MAGRLQQCQAARGARRKTSSRSLQAEPSRPGRAAPELPARVQGPTCKQGRHQQIYGDCVYVSASIRGQLVGLQHERGMHWRAYFHEVDLGLIEIVNINDALSMLSAPESIAENPNKGTSISSIVSILPLSELSAMS